MKSIHPIKRRAAGAALWVLGILGASSALAQTMPHQSKFESVGTVNCTSSTCHGSIGERSSAPVLQNEYTTWLRQDAHTQAYSVLLNAQSRRIAKNMGLSQPAHQSKVCLDCHSHNPAPSRQGERFDQTDGVNCEACHGPAGSWIKTHVEPNPSHQKNIENGLYPTNEPYAAAKLCLSCHQGDASRPITHQIMGAGHPRLSIEIDTFMALQPPHYNIDDDWIKRKGAYDSSKFWAMGQFVAAENLLSLIADSRRNSQGLMPEFMMFDCHACHAPMKKLTWEKGMAATPGQPRINDSSLLMVGAIVRAVLPQDYPEFQRQLTNLHAASTSTSANLKTLAQTSKNFKGLLSNLRAKVAGTPMTQANLNSILSEIVAISSNNGYTDYAGAEQAYMSISSVANSLSNKGGSRIAAKVNPGLRKMIQILKDEDNYDRAAFQSELMRLNEMVGVKAQ